MIDTENELLEVLREMAKYHEPIHAMVKKIKETESTEKFCPFLVANYFMKAFNLTFSQVKELPGAACLGGAVYTDSEINAVIYLAINSAKH